MNIFNLRSKTASKRSQSSSAARQSDVPQQPSRGAPFSSHSAAASLADATTSMAPTHPVPTPKSKQKPAQPPEERIIPTNSSQASSHSRESQAPTALSPPPRTSSRDAKSVFLSQSEMYTHHDLQHFSFGAPSTTPSPHSRATDPLCVSDDADSDEFSINHDTTPRPSVAGTQYPRSHQSQAGPDGGRQPAFPGPHRSAMGRRPSKPSNPEDPPSKVFVNSSASASASSLSRPSQPTSRSASRTDNTSLSSPRQSSQGFMSEDDSDAGRHPLPLPRSTASSRQRRRDDPDSSVYISDEEFTMDSEQDVGGESEAELNAGAGEQRRGSLAIPTHLDQRNRDPAFSAPRRPSKSLEDLHSFSFGKGSSSRPADDQPAPTSAPQLGGDWQSMRERSIQRDQISPHTNDPNGSSSQATVASGLDGFIPLWQTFGVNGIIDLDMSEIADVVTTHPSGVKNPSYFDFRRGSTNSTSTRRQSTISDDIFHRRLMNQWGSKKYQLQRQRWAFSQEDRAVEEPAKRTFFASRPSISGESSSRSLFDRESKSKDKGKGKEKAKNKEPWRGMQPGTDELWVNGSSGKFKVYRKSTPNQEAGKPPQQRLQIHHVRVLDILHPTTNEPMEAPGVTIHKHSKAWAFSISRHYRTRGQTGQDINGKPTNASHATSGANISSKDSHGGGGRRSDMILLATRKVQKAYTSTNTTRKLESHGLLDDDLTRSQDYDRTTRREGDVDHQRSNKGKEKEREDLKELERKQRRDERDKGRARRKAAEASGSGLVESAGSVAASVDMEEVTPSTSASTSPGQPLAHHHRPHGSIDQTVITEETVSSDKTINQRRVLLAATQHRETAQDAEYDDDDDDDDSLGLAPRRRHPTSHQETYSTLPAESFDMPHSQNQPHVLLSWIRKDRENKGSRDKPYSPYWPIVHHHSNTSSSRPGIVEDLNVSFQDVGLLPSQGEVKNNSRKSNHKRDPKSAKQGSTRPKDPELDVFDIIPPDCLYMLIPLWPGETDPLSAKKYPTPLAPIPAASRHYLLIWYKTKQPLEELRATSGEKDKKRSRGSPTSSRESAHRRDERGVILRDFHITGRVLSYKELQGSGVRLPDVGLAVSGPLKEAYTDIPHRGDDSEYVLGMCLSHETGVEFVPEGFEKLGLGRTVPNPTPCEPSDEDDRESLDTICVPTALGRAVMEMAWLGMMAATSFNPNPST